MKEHPILFSAPMVRAILDGSKTQTRRVCKFPKYMGEVENLKEHGALSGDPDCPYSGDHNDPTSWGFPFAEDGSDIALDATWAPLLCPYGKPGEQLWVRETFGEVLSRYAYRANPSDDAQWGAGKPSQGGFVWKPSIHMPRRASRIQLEITDVRVERLQDISRGDAMEEGCPFPNMAKGDDPRKWYSNLWEDISGVDSWAKNPWVWVVSFKRIRP